MLCMIRDISVRPRVVRRRGLVVFRWALFTLLLGPGVISAGLPSERDVVGARSDQSSETQGKVGLELAVDGEKRIVVRAAVPDGPAERAGIRSDDIVMEIDGEVAQGRPVAEVAKMISGPAGTDVTLLVWHTSKRTSEKLVLRRVSLPATAPSAQASTPAAAKADASLWETVRLQRFSIVDEQGTRGEAYHLLIPSGWKAEGKILWDLERKAAPASLSVRVRNPDAPEEFDAFPPQYFTWSPLFAQMGMEQTGSTQRGGGKRYLGCEIARPLDGPLAALRQIVLPRFRPELRDYKVVAAEELPKLAEAAAPLYLPAGMPGVVRAGRIRIETSDANGAGIAVQEDLTCIFVCSEGPSGSTWGLDSITAFRAPKEKLDARLPLYRTMLFSLQPNPEWYEELSRTTRILVEGFFQDQAQIMRRVEIERQKNDAIRSTIRQEFDSRQAAMSRIHENYDTKAVRGVQRRVNPFDGSTEDVPNEYEHAWVNPLGEHIYSNSPGFDPNVGSNHDWREMPPKN